MYFTLRNENRYGYQKRIVKIRKDRYDCEKGEKMDKKSEIGIVDKKETMSTKFNLMFEPVDIKDSDTFVTEEIVDGYKVKYITIDDDPESPRDCDNIGTMVCFHKKYVLGDEEHCYTREDFCSWEELEKAIEDNEDVAIILPLYLYDHCRITIRTYPFSDKWDSGQIGFVFVSKDKIREEFSVTDITDEILDKVKMLMKGEVEMYSEYLAGDVYRVVMETFDKDKCQKDYDLVGVYYGIKCAKEGLKTL